jgi:GNAT superfamily N-acetyltransferase
MATIDALTWSALSATDIDAAVGLNTEAGWNQNAADWRFMLEQGEGMGVRRGDLVATSMLLPRGDRFAWIAMILVTARWRRQGLASELMRRCLERAATLKLIAGLDATDAGRQIYLPLGFQDIYPLTRWRADAVAVKAGAEAGTRSMGRDDLERVAAWDAGISGAPRKALLAHLHGRRPERAFIVEAGGAVRGFVLARDGRQATQIGPLIAEDDATAAALLRASLGAGAGPVLLDAADHHGRFAPFLRQAGFREQRGYMRMLLGRAEPLDDPNRVFLIAGAELG